jgi:uncharacterized membrane-anchored protein
VFTLSVIACVANAVVTVVAFFQYVRMRMADRPALEQKWRSIHFLTLALFVFFGVIVLVQLSHRLNTAHIY